MDYGGRTNGASTVEWYTPPHVFDALGLTFDLDPCAPAGGVPWIPAERHYSIADNGLAQPWDGRVWLNPPYGRAAGIWVARLAQYGNGVALVFARTDTAWGQAAMLAADAVCLVSGRLSFIDGTTTERKGHNAAAPSMLLGYGAACAKAVLNCDLGLAFTPGDSEARWPHDHVAAWVARSIGVSLAQPRTGQMPQEYQRQMTLSHEMRHDTPQTQPHSQTCPFGRVSHPTRPAADPPGPQRPQTPPGPGQTPRPAPPPQAAGPGPATAPQDTP